MKDREYYGPFMTTAEAYGKEKEKCPDYKREKGLCTKEDYSYPFDFFIR